MVLNRSPYIKINGPRNAKKNMSYNTEAPLHLNNGMTPIYDFGYNVSYKNNYENLRVNKHSDPTPKAQLHD